ncbi:hypothetical protein G9U52_31120 [Paenibacillus sp. S3N08]|uniref:Uncharacterized protein n=1 Tax=Paenibacillus agricola TaxID=2716264 RepID=A0ABX0JH79_9BACL|nr:hypothetical protein [Paenibacillus agricola]
MKYYLSYKGKVFGHALTKEEAEMKLKLLSGTLEGVEVMEFDDKLIPIKKSRLVNTTGKRKRPKK